MEAVYRSWFGVSASVLHQRFQLWRHLGVFEQLMAALAHVYGQERRIKWRWQSVDSKSCPAPLGSEATGRNPTDRGKRGSKVHMLVDTRGAPLAMYVFGVNQHDKRSSTDLHHQYHGRVSGKQNSTSESTVATTISTFTKLSLRSSTLPLSSIGVGEASLF